MHSRLLKLRIQGQTSPWRSSDVLAGGGLPGFDDGRRADSAWEDNGRTASYSRTKFVILRRERTDNESGVFCDSAGTCEKTE